jgi:hypothetical protein
MKKLLGRANKSSKGTVRRRQPWGRLLVENLEVRLTPTTVADAVWVNDNWVDTANQGNPQFGDTVTAPFPETAPNATTLIYGVNAFSTIQAGVNADDAGGTVYVLPGTYVENVNVDKSVTLVGAGQGASFVVPAISSITSDPTTGSAIISVQSSGVHITGFTLDGDNPALTSGHVVGGADIDATSGIVTAYNASENYDNLEIDHVTVKNIYLRGIEARMTGTFNIHDNIVDNVQGDINLSVAIFNRNGGGVISHNTVSHTPDAINANHSRGTQFLNNTITASQSGIHTDNSRDSGGTGTDLIQGNSVSLGDEMGAPPSYGIWAFVPYQNVTIRDNTVSGVDIGIAAYGQGSAAGTVTIDHNTVDLGDAAGSVGVDISTTTPGFGSFNVAASLINGNTVSNASTGVSIHQDPGFVASVTITGNTGSIYGNAIGIDVNGGSATISGNQIYDNTTGIRLTNGGTASVDSNDFTGTTSNATDLRLDASAGLLTGTFASNQFAATTTFIDNRSSQNLDATADTFNVGGGGAQVGGAGLTLAEPYAVEDKITDYLHDPTLGYVRLQNGQVFVAHNSETANTGAVQRGVNVGVAGDIVHLQNGNYTASDVVISTSLTVRGDSEAGVVITPNGTDSHDNSTTGGTALQGFIVETSAVDIDHLTIDGGAGQNFRQGVLADSNLGWSGANGGSLTVDHVTVNNVFRKGIALYSRNSLTTGNAITNNTFDSVATSPINDFESAYAIADFSSSGTISGNVITNSGAGIGTNYLDGIPADQPVLTIGNNQYSSPATTTGNPAIGLDLSALAAGSTVFGNTVDLTGGGNDLGVVVQYAGPGGLITVHDNNITTAGGDTALLLYQDQDSANPVIISHNTLQGTATDTGVLATDDGTIFGESPHVGTTDATLTGNAISGFGTAIGVQSAGTTPVSVTIGSALASDDNTISGTGGGTGILVQGSESSAAVTNNSAPIHGFAIGIDVNGGSATISGNHVYDNGVGIEFISGGSGSVSGNNFAGSVDNGTDLWLSPTAGTVTIGDGNQFAGSTYTIENQTSQAFDLSGYTSTTFGGVNPTSAALAQLYAIEVTIVDAIDVASYGLVRLRAQNVYVTPNSFFSPISTTPSIQRGIQAATTGDTVNVEAGTYNEDVTVNKMVTLSGAQAGVAAPGRSGPESVINTPDGHTELQISVSDATVDGFTIQGNTNDNLLGTGVYLVPGISGTHFLNNIVQNNIAGMFLANANPADQAVIQGNLFQNNNNAGSATGTGIYADEFTAGNSGVQNVLIKNNSFTNSSFVEDSWGIGISNTSSPNFDDITVQGNTFSNSGRGMYFFQASNVTIDANTVSGASHYAVGLFGPSDTNFSISQNTLDGNGDGIQIASGITATMDVTGLSIQNNFIRNNGNFIPSHSDNDGIYIDSSVTVASGGIAANFNDLSGNVNAGLENQSTVSVDASNNWWGSADGPTTRLNTYKNPTGGVAVIGTDVTIAPWLFDGTDAQPPVPGSQHENADATMPVITTSDQNATEGIFTAIPLGSFTDPVSATGLWHVVVNWGDGSPAQDFYQNSDGSLGSLSHTYAEESSTPFTVSVQVTDGSGNSATQSFNMTVADANLSNPVLTPPSGLTEGDSVTAQTVFTFHDAYTSAPASDFTAMVHTGDATLDSVSNASAVQVVSLGGGDFAVQLSYTYLDELSGATFSVSVADDGLSSTSASGSITVADATLSNAVLTPPSGLTEGDSVTAQTVFTFHDAYTSAPATDFTATVDTGDATLMGSSAPGAVQVVSLGGGDFAVRLSYTYLDELSGATFSVSVADDGGSSTSAGGSITVADAALNSGTLNATGGVEYTTPTSLTATFSDANHGAPTTDFSGSINWGDGHTTPFDSSVVSGSGGSYTISTSHQYATSATFNITVTINDDGGSSTMDSGSTMVGLASSKLVFGVQPSNTTAGQIITPAVTVTVEDSFGTIVSTDNSSVTLAVGTGSGTLSGATTRPLMNGVATFNDLFINKAGTGYTLTAADGMISTATSSTFTITPGTATKVAFGVQPSTTTATMTISPAVTVQVEDSLGNTVTTDHSFVSMTLGNNPGGGTLSGTLTMQAMNGVATFNDLSISKKGVGYTLLGFDGSLSPGTSSPFTILTNYLIVSSLTAEPTGFVITFNKPFNTSDLNIYDGGTHLLGAPVLTLTGMNSGPVITYDPIAHRTNALGSLIVTSPTTLTYVYTGSMLPDDTYALTLFGTKLDGKVGFEDQSMPPVAMDGTDTNNSGSNYTTTFTTTFNADVVGVGVPSFARGPGQNVSLVVPNPGLNNPNTYYPGIPVQLSDGDNATSVTFTLTYNTALLNVAGASVDTSLIYPAAPVGSTFTRTSQMVVSGIETDVFTFSTNGHGTLGTGQGTVTIGQLQATIPNTLNQTIYKAKELLTISGVSVTGTKPGVAANSLQVIAYPADASGDGAYAGNDGSLVGRVAGGQDSGFLAFSLVDPVVIADVDGSGVVDANDASQVLQAGVHRTVPNITPIPAGAQVKPSTAPDPLLSLPASLQVNADGTMSVPVNLDEARPAGSTGLTEATLALRFDPSIFTIAPSDIHLGTIPQAGSGWSLTSAVDAATGQLAITLYSLTPIASNLAGSLVTIDFHAQPGAAVGTSSIQLAASVDPNGQGSYVTNVADSNGAMILGLAPTNTPNPALDGTVVLLASPVSAVTVVSSTSAVASVEPEVVVSATPVVSVVVESSGEESSAPAAAGTANTSSEHAAKTAAHPAGVVASMLSQATAQAAAAVFQVGLSPAALAVPLPAASEQHLADRLFQAAAHGVVDLSDLALVGGASQDAMSQYLGRQPQEGQGSELGGFRLDDLDLPVDLGPSVASSGRRQKTPSPVPQAAVTDPSALSEYFARLAADDDADVESNS